MEMTQIYTRRSSASVDTEGLRLDVATEQSRPPVCLEAKIQDSLEYARLMLALYAVVSGDFRSQNKDHTAYQEWVQQRYLEELPAAMAEHAAKAPALLQRRKELHEQIKLKQKDMREHHQNLLSGDYYTAQRQYFKWLLTHNYAAWYVLDPVVSFHPDCLIFEVFSQDESSYGRVTVPTDRLDIFGETQYGTTNIDFSHQLAEEM